MLLSEAAERLWTLISGGLDTDQADPAQARQEAARITTEKLRELIGRCPICGETNLQDHAYASFAFASMSEEKWEGFVALRQAIMSEQWAAAVKWQGFDVLSDNAVAHAWRCVTGRLAVLIERDPVEMNDAADMLYESKLDEASGQQLASQIEPGQWRVLSR